MEIVPYYIYCYIRVKSQKIPTAISLLSPFAPSTSRVKGYRLNVGLDVLFTVSNSISGTLSPYSIVFVRNKQIPSSSPFLKHEDSEFLKDCKKLNLFPPV